MTATSLSSPSYFAGPYDETMSMMVEARNYMAYTIGKERAGITGIDGLTISCESMRVTTRLAHVLAWLAIRRAVHEGEISEEEALNDRYRLPSEGVCLDDGNADSPFLPRGLRGLLARSLALYSRIARLEDQMLRRKEAA